MNNILYVTKYTRAHNMCPSITYSLLNQNKKPNILAVFDNCIIKDLYYNYFVSYSNYITFYASNVLKINLLRDYLAKYKWFVFLSTDCLYDRDYCEEVEKFCLSSDGSNFLISPQNHKHSSSKTTVFTNDFIKQQIINDEKFDNIFQTYNPALSNIRSFISFKSVALDSYIVDSNTFYEDNYCVFCNFINNSKYNLLDSFVYINKNNNRVYNIANNIVGQLINRTTNSMTMDWQNDQNQTVSINYIYDPLTKSYVSY